VTVLALLSAGLKLPLRDAEIITMTTLERAFANAVTLRGVVTQLLRYPFTPSVRVADLTPEPMALIQPDWYTSKNALVQFESGKAVFVDRVVNEVHSLLEEINWDYA
jgi:hypothetical protein